MSEWCCGSAAWLALRLRTVSVPALGSIPVEMFMVPAWKR